MSGTPLHVADLRVSAENQRGPPAESPPGRPPRHPGANPCTATSHTSCAAR